VNVEFGQFALEEVDDPDSEELSVMRRLSNSKVVISVFVAVLLPVHVGDHFFCFHMELSGLRRLSKSKGIITVFVAVLDLVRLSDHFSRFDIEVEEFNT